MSQIIRPPSQLNPTAGGGSAIWIFDRASVNIGGNVNIAASIAVNHIYGEMQPTRIGVTIRKISISVAVVGAAGAKAYIGIYDAITRNKILDAALPTDALNGQTATINQGVVYLPAGMYWWVWAQSETTATLPTILSSWQAGTPASNISNKNVQRISSNFGNLVSGGIMPANLGTLGTLTTRSMPACIFES